MGTRININDNGKVGKVNTTEKGDIINIPHKRHITKKQKTPWVTGSFYLVLVIVVISALTIVGKLLPLYALPIIIIGCLLFLSIIGALQLRNDDKLCEKNFVQLMMLSFKYIPFLTKKRN